MIIAGLVTGAALLVSSFRGDFDHDGRPDLAHIIQRSPNRFDLVIQRAADPNHPITVDTTGDLTNYFVVRAKPGKYQTACGKGYGSEDSPPCSPKWITLDGDNLAIGTEESSEAVVVWTGKRFETIFLSE